MRKEWNYTAVRLKHRKKVKCKKSEMQKKVKYKKEISSGIVAAEAQSNKVKRKKGDVQER